MQKKWTVLTIFMLFAVIAGTCSASRIPAELEGLRGVCGVVSTSGRADLPLEIAKLGGLVVHCITIDGSVERAALRAGGDIIVSCGLYGKDGITVRAGGDITCRFAENTDLYAGGNLYVLRSMVNCRAEVGEKICFKCMGKALIGGHIIAPCGVEAFSLGNPRTPIITIVEFGVREELARQVSALAKDFRQTYDECKESDEKDKKANIKRLLEIRDHLDPLREALEQQKRARVAVDGNTYPDVRLVWGNTKYDVTTKTTRMIFYKVKGKDEILTRAYTAEKEFADESECDDDSISPPSSEADEISNEAFEMPLNS